MPTLSRSAVIRPATCVPWSAKPVGAAASQRSVETKLFGAGATCPTRSGCSASMAWSTTATVTSWPSQPLSHARSPSTSPSLGHSRGYDTSRREMHVDVGRGDHDVRVGVEGGQRRSSSASGTLTTSVFGSDSIRSCSTPASARSWARSLAVKPWSRRTMMSAA